jgi:hypothetical protein
MSWPFDGTCTNSHISLPWQVQAHGGNFDDSAALFFLPHTPLVECQEKLPPLFLLMKGTDWRGAGADHYDPLIAQKRIRADDCSPYITL